MEIQRGNIFSIPSEGESQPEYFQSIVETPEFLIERIITTDQFKAPGQWYDQEKDEWVVLIRGEAELEFEDGSVINLLQGDFVLINAHHKHRLKQVSTFPNCVWLAIHGNLK